MVLKAELALFGVRLQKDSEDSASDYLEPL